MNIKNGFTLIEMIVVTVVISIVVGVLVGYFFNLHREASFEARCNQVSETLLKLNEAQYIYYSKNGEYATREELLESGIVKAWPTPDKELENTTCTADTGHAFEYQFWLDEEVPEKKELIAVLPCIKQEYVDYINR